MKIYNFEIIANPASASNITLSVKSEVLEYSTGKFIVKRYLRNLFTITACKLILSAEKAQEIIATFNTLFR